MKKLILFCFAVLILLSCNTTKSLNNIDGVYESKIGSKISLKNGLYEIVLFSDKIENGGSIIGYSNGKFINNKKKKILRLDSKKLDENLGVKILPFEVTSSDIDSTKIYFSFENTEQFNKINLDISTIIIIYVNDQIIDRISFNPSIENKFIVDKKIEPYSLIAFDIFIGLGSEFCFSFSNTNSFYGFNYVSDFDKNYFKIKFPSISEDDFKYIFLKDDIMEYNRKLIKWNGDEYFKK